MRSTTKVTAVLASLLFLATACVVDSPNIDTRAAGNAVNGVDDVTTTPTNDEPVAEPTVAPEPTAVPEPTAAPTPTTEPTPEPTPTPGEPTTAVAVVEPTLELAPAPVDAGRIALSVAGTTTVRLSETRPVLHVPGHVLIYVDDLRNAEVDIFTPIADPDGALFDDIEAIESYLLTASNVDTITSTSTVTIAGLTTQIFDVATTGDIVRTVHTDTSTLDNEAAGWFAPPLARLWLIDTPNGAVVVSAESFDESRFDEAVRLAEEILSSIEFES